VRLRHALRNGAADDVTGLPRCSDRLTWMWWSGK